MPAGSASCSASPAAASAGEREPHDFGQGECVGGLGDVAQNTAGRDRRQLAVITDQAHTGALAQRVGDHRVQPGGGGLAGLVDDDQRVGPNAVEPVGRRRRPRPWRGRRDHTYLSRVSVVAPRSSPSTIAASAVGAKPMTCPPELRHACARAAIAVVLPVPAGASASATRRPAGGHLRRPARPGRG